MTEVWGNENNHAIYNYINSHESFRCDAIINDSEKYMFDAARNI